MATLEPGENARLLLSCADARAPKRALRRRLWVSGRFVRFGSNVGQKISNVRHFARPRQQPTVSAAPEPRCDYFGQQHVQRQSGDFFGTAAASAQAQSQQSAERESVRYALREAVCELGDADAAERSRRDLACDEPQQQRFSVLSPVPQHKPTRGEVYGYNTGATYGSQLAVVPAQHATAIAPRLVPRVWALSEACPRDEPAAKLQSVGVISSF